MSCSRVYGYVEHVSGASRNMQISQAFRHIETTSRHTRSLTLFTKREWVASAGAYGRCHMGRYR